MARVPRLLQKNKTGEPSWRWRRTVALTSIVYCMAMIVYLADNSDTILNTTIAEGLIWLLFGLVLLYTGFATAQDITAIIVARSARPYADDVQSVDPPPADPTTVVTDTVVTGGPTTVQQPVTRRRRKPPAEPEGDVNPMGRD